MERRKHSRLVGRGNSRQRRKANKHLLEILLGVQVIGEKQRVVLNTKQRTPHQESTNPKETTKVHPGRRSTQKKERKKGVKRFSRLDVPLVTRERKVKSWSNNKGPKRWRTWCATGRSRRFILLMVPGLILLSRLVKVDLRK